MSAPSWVASHDNTGRPRACGGEDLSRDLTDYDRAFGLVRDDGQVS